MVNFKRVEITDKETIENFTSKFTLRNSEMCFSTIYLSCYTENFYTIYGGYLIYRVFIEGRFGYNILCGEGDLAPVYEMIITDVKNATGETKTQRVLLFITNEAVKTQLEALTGITVTESRDDFDYIYEAVNLIELTGKKYHAKRNFVNRFFEQYNAKYQSITNADTEKIKDFAEALCKANGCLENKTLSNEQTGIARCIDHMETLNMLGGFITVDEKVVAFTMGQKLHSNSDTFVIHFEKACPDFKGAYQAINQCFAEDNCKEIKYINREEDMGIEGLRKAKMSYHPQFFSKKYIIQLKVGG